MTTLHVLRVFVGPGRTGGNPLGVFLDGAAIEAEPRQTVTVECGFAETGGQWNGHAYRKELYEQVVEGLLGEMALGAGTLTRVVSALAGADADPDRRELDRIGGGGPGPRPALRNAGSGRYSRESSARKCVRLVGARGLTTSISFSWPDEGPALAGGWFDYPDKTRALAAMEQAGTTEQRRCVLCKA